MPVHAEVAGQRRYGGVVVGQRRDRQPTARVVSLARGATSSWVSENVEVGQAGSAHRQTRLRQTSTVGVPKHGASWARCSRRPCPTATTPQVGQPVPVWSAPPSHQPALGVSHRE